MAKPPILKRRNPKQQSTPLTPDEKREAKRAAKKHGRSTPSLVDNINAQQHSGKRNKRKRKKSKKSR